LPDYALRQWSRTVAVPESKLSPRALTAQVKEQQALDLRLAGHTFDGIAQQLGYASRSSAYRAVERALQRIRVQADQTAETLRALEDARYDRLLRAIEAQVQQGNLAAIDRALRISKARRELWGLDAPTRVDAELSPAMQALLSGWQALEQPVAEPSGDARMPVVNAWWEGLEERLALPEVTDTATTFDETGRSRFQWPTKNIESDG
jgi:chemotaxis protein histidine kinase CheA